MDTVLTEIQKITLKDILTTSGLKQRQVEDIFLLLNFKPERVQLAFYYRACGETYEWIGEVLNTPRRTVNDWVNINCVDICMYLKG